MTVKRGWSNWVWLLLMVMAPVAGGVISYFTLTWTASGGGSADGMASSAEAQAVSPQRGRMTVEGARLFEDYPTLWVGEEFDGMPVTSVSRLHFSEPPGLPAPDTDMITVVYGDCTLSGRPPTCVPPVQIASTPYCLRPPSLAAPAVLDGEPFELRGATAQWVGRGHNTLVLYTGQLTVTVIATAGEATALDVANRLHAINGLGPGSPSEPLGPVAALCP